MGCDDPCMDEYEGILHPCGSAKRLQAISVYVFWRKADVFLVSPLLAANLVPKKKD